MDSRARVVLLVVLAAGLAGCGAPAAAAASGPAAAPASARPYPVSQRLTLNNHCLIREANVDGQYWKAVTPRQAPAYLPGPDGLVAVTGN